MRYNDLKQLMIYADRQAKQLLGFYDVEIITRNLAIILKK